MQGTWTLRDLWQRLSAQAFSISDIRASLLNEVGPSHPTQHSSVLAHNPLVSLSHCSNQRVAVQIWTWILLLCCQALVHLELLGKPEGEALC